MSNKKYFFLSGLPRSGNTLLSCILNQNPDVLVSANSIVPDIFANTINLQNHEIFQNFPDQNSLEDFLKSIFDSYYKNWNAKYIIDRAPWGTVNNLFILKNIFEEKEIKILCTVRDIVEIIASFVKANPSFLNERLAFEYQSGLRFPNFKKSDLEIKCEIINRNDGQLQKNLAALSNLLLEENRKYLHLIEYNDLIKDPDKTLKKIYDFLELPGFKHSFKKINQFRVNNVSYDDKIYGCDMHTIKENLKDPEYKLDEVLTPELIQRYRGMEFWR